MNHLLLLLILLANIFSTSATAQVRVHDNNNTTIGNFSGSSGPAENLWVGGTTYFNCIPASSGFFFSSDNSGGGTLVEPILLPQWGNSMYLGNSSTPLWRVYSHGLFYGTGGLQQYSDSTLKTNIEPANLGGSLATLAQIKTYYFDFKSETWLSSPVEKHQKLEEAASNQHGFIAQQLQTVFPYAVSIDENSGLLTVDYLKLIPLMIEAIQEQQQEIEQLKAEIEQLKNE